MPCGHVHVCTAHVGQVYFAMICLLMLYVACIRVYVVARMCMSGQNFAVPSGITGLVTVLVGSVQPAVSFHNHSTIIFPLPAGSVRVHAFGDGCSVQSSKCCLFIWLFPVRYID